MKKLISLLLCAVMLFTLGVPYVAAEETAPAAYDGNPLVIVRGFDATGLKSEDGSFAINLQFSDVVTVAKSFILDFVVSKDSELFLDNVMTVLGNVFFALGNDAEGNSIQTIYFDKYDGSMAENEQALASFGDIAEEGLVKTACDKIGSENVYYFTYDWRRSAKELASDLNTFIKSVTKASGAKKVNIVAVSMGGMVTTSYLYQYGAGKVDNLTFLSSTHNGTYTCGDCFNGDIYFDGTVFYNQTKRLIQGNIITDILLTVMNSMGLFDSAAQALNDIVSDTSYILNSDIMRNSLGSLLGLWALCPDDVFDSAVEFIYSGHEEEYPVMMEKLEETREFLFATETTLKKAAAKGAKLSFISNYGSPMAPYYKHSNLMGDSVLETKLTSNFANVALYGETLTDEELAGVSSKYISPDRTIDASAAKFKTKVWFVKDAGHVPTEYNSEFSEFVLWLALSETQLNVASDKAYPRFMILDSEGKLTADVE